MPGSPTSTRRDCVPRDDWKYDEEMWDGKKEEEELPPEKQCPRCLHWVPQEEQHCNWCGKVFRERDR